MFVSPTKEMEMSNSDPGAKALASNFRLFHEWPSPHKYALQTYPNFRRQPRQPLISTWRPEAHNQECRTDPREVCFYNDNEISAV